MAEGGRIEPGPAAPAAGPGPVPAELIREAGRAVRAEWAADLLEAGAGMQSVRLAGGDTCLCAECLWLRSVLALLRNLAGQ